jgi:small subunit ribosomal protein S5
MIKAALDALVQCSSPRSVASRRGKKVGEVFGSRKGAEAEVRE